MGNQPANNERLIGEIAARQHGVLSSAQTPGGGHLEGRGFQASQGRAPVPHYIAGFTRWDMPDSASKAAVWRPSLPSVPALWSATRRIHRSHSLTVGVTTRRNGIAVTKPGRTLRDLHRTSPQPVFRRALRRALDLRLVSSADVRRVAYLTRSELERIWWTDLPSLRPCTPCSA